MDGVGLGPPHTAFNRILLGIALQNASLSLMQDNTKPALHAKNTTFMGSNIALK